MPLTLCDEILKQAGMTADDAGIEIACRLFDARKLGLWPAAQLSPALAHAVRGRVAKERAANLSAHSG